MSGWKYQIGDNVSTTLKNGPEAMLIVGRITEEFPTNTQRWYICSHFKFGGEHERMKLLDEEITSFVPDSK